MIICDSNIYYNMQYNICNVYFIFCINKVKLLSLLKEDKSITVSMLLCLLLLAIWISNSQQGNYLAFIFITCDNSNCYTCLTHNITCYSSNC